MGIALRWVGQHVRGFYTQAGLLLSAGLILAVSGLWGLAMLTEEVLEGDTVRVDGAVLSWLNERATPGLDHAAVEVTALGDTLVVIMVAVIAVSLLWLLGRRAYAALLAISVTGGGVITPVLKMVFERPRPQLLEWQAHYAETSASYPSGHATMAMVTLTAVALIIQRLSSRRWVGAVAMVVAGVTILLIGLSRLYLGLHFPSDVLAGFAVGFAWTVFSALTVETLQHRGGGEGPSPDREAMTQSVATET